MSNLKFLLLQQNGGGHSPCWAFGSHTLSAFSGTSGPHCPPLSAAAQEAFAEDAPHLQCWQEVESGGGFTLQLHTWWVRTPPQLSFYLANLLRFATKPTYCLHKGSLEITNGLLHPALKGVWAHRHKGCLTSKGSITHVIKSLLSEQGTAPENLFSNAEISALAQQYARYKNSAIIITSGWENSNKSFELTVVFTNSPELSSSRTFFKLLWILKPIKTLQLEWE